MRDYLRNRSVLYETLEGQTRIEVTSGGTVSESAVMVIAGVIPVALLAKKHKAIHKRNGEKPREVVVARVEPPRTLDEWQLS